MSGIGSSEWVSEGELASLGPVDRVRVLVGDRPKSGEAIVLIDTSHRGTYPNVREVEAEALWWSARVERGQRVLVRVPPGCASWPLDRERAEREGCPPSDLPGPGEELPVWWVLSRGVLGVVRAGSSSPARFVASPHSGACCSRCGEHNPYAEEAGFTCYLCRSDPHRMSL